MGSILINKNITFDEINWNNDLSFDILIELIILRIIPKETVVVDGNVHIVQEISDNSWWIISSVRNKFSLKINY